MKFKKNGKNVVIYPLAKILNPEVISIGDNVIIDDFVLIMGGKETKIGNYVHIASFCNITGGGKFIMEDFSGLSSGCRIFTGTEDFSGSSLTNPTIPAEFRNIVRSFVVIKKHVIIGANVVVLPGVTIGEGTAIGANSLVKKDCEPWMIYVGSPAKPLRTRPKEIIMEMEAQLELQRK
ncbi:MAG: acyltransferase [Deltaproteobacteria bacterium]|nr:MAG: acyltransferase [Deltaproteobacteria bacterium]